jgi:hypothetical protein
MAIRFCTREGSSSEGSASEGSASVENAQAAQQFLHSGDVTLKIHYVS